MVPKPENRRPAFDQSAYTPVFTVPFKDVYADLRRLSSALQEALPDPSLGPQERLERLARVVPQSVAETQQLCTGRTKLSRLQRRLDELVPGPGSMDQKLDTLLSTLEALVPGPGRTIDKLETLGDYRYTDVSYRPKLPEDWT